MIALCVLLVGMVTTPAVPLSGTKEAVAARTLARSGGAAHTDPMKKDGDCSGFLTISRTTMKVH